MPWKGSVNTRLVMIIYKVIIIFIMYDAYSSQGNLQLGILMVKVPPGLPVISHHELTVN